MVVTSRHLEVGRIGEEAALALYLERGYRPVAKNWRCRLGELDLVLWRDRTLVFCEVKARRGSSLGGAYEAVTATKQRKLQLLAEAFLESTSLKPHRIRFDVASVSMTTQGRPEIHLFEDAF